jgi:hypothetical protein
MGTRQQRQAVVVGDQVATALRVPRDMHGQVFQVAELCKRSVNATYVELIRLALTGHCQADVTTALEEAFPVG